MDSGNAIEPYRWVARYVGGGMLRQFDADGLHYSDEIDRARVVALELLGHPVGPLLVARRRDRIPDAVVVRARARLQIPGRVGVTILAGFRYGDQCEGLTIDDAGRVTRGVWRWS
jgi:hypothetical protein